jgi:hypothetical protein
MSTATAAVMAMATEMATTMATVMAMATATETATQHRHRSLSLNHPCHHCASHCRAPLTPRHLHPTPSPPSRTPLFHTHRGHHHWLIVVCFMGGQSKRIDVVIARAPPPPQPSSLSPFTYLARPTIARHIRLGHHGWLIVIFKGGRRGECAFYCNCWVAGQLPGRKSCMHVSFFEKTVPASKKATNRNCQGMLKVIQHALMAAKL